MLLTAIFAGGPLMSWSGVHAVMVTPFNMDLSLDEAGLRANAQFLAGTSVDVLICLGTEGEFYALTDDERRRVVEIVVDEVGSRKPVICGVSHPSSRVAATLARHAADVGVQGVIALAPYVVRSDAAGIASYYQAIAEAAELPTFIYNSPGRVGYNLPPRQILELAALPNIIGVKQAAPDLAELAELIGARTNLVVIGGAETSFWPAVCIGASGNTATAASAFPTIFARMWQAAQAADLAGGQALYYELAPLRRAYSMTGGQAAVVKRACSLVGLAGGPVRPPAQPAPDGVDQLLAPLVERYAD